MASYSCRRLTVVRFGLWVLIAIIQTNKHCGPDRQPEHNPANGANSIGSPLDPNLLKQTAMPFPNTETKIVNTPIFAHEEFKGSFLHTQKTQAVNSRRVHDT